MFRFRWLLLSSAALFSAPSAWAGDPVLPTGGQYAAGAGTISQSGAAMTVTQTSNRGVIDWKGFSIGQGGAVHVDNGGGATLNRVTGGQASSIAGTLTATGSLYLVNPQGVVVAPSGVVKAGGDVVASTHDISNQTFMSGGPALLKSDSPGTISNLGRVSSAGGDVVLIAREVSNAGTIQAPKGTAVLAGGTEVLLTEKSGHSDERAFVRAGVGRIDNQGVIEAAQAELKAAGGNIYALAGNNGGIVRATGSETRGGRILLTTEDGDIANSGTLAARNADGAGGRVTVQAPRGTIQHTGTIDARATGAGKAGGTVTMTGDRVGLMDGSSTNASGPGGGGSAKIGGDARGAGPLPNSRKVLVQKNATVRADATDRGKGGQVVVYGTETAQVHGTVTARGGANGGDGGFIETSAAHLDVTAPPNAGADKGAAGQWLIDPFDLVISAAGPDANIATGSSPWTATDPSTAATVAISTILTALNSGDVSISTQGGLDATHGDITIADGISFATDRTLNRTLTLTAAKNVIVNGAIAPASGTAGLSLAFSATSKIQVNQPVSTGGGAIAFTGQNNGVELAADITTARTGGTGGAIDITGNLQALTVNGARTLTSGGGLIALHNGFVDAHAATGDSLTLTAGAGAVTFDNYVGNDATNRLTALTVDSTGITTLMRGDSTQGKGIRVNGPVHFTGPVVTSTSQQAVINTQGGNGAITFDGSVNGSTSNTQYLYLSAGTGDITFNGAVGGTNSLAVVEIDTARNATFNDRVTIGQSLYSGGYDPGQTGVSGVLEFKKALTIGQSLTVKRATGGTVFNDTVTANSGSFSNTSATFTDATKTYTFTNGANFDSTVGSVTLSGTLAATNNLIALADNADGAITYLGGNATINVGTGAILLRKVVPSPSLQTPASLTIRARQTNVYGDAITAGNAIDISGSLLVYNDLTLTSGSGGITLGSASAYSRSDASIPGGLLFSSLTMNAGSGDVSVGALNQTVLGYYSFDTVAINTTGTTTLLGDIYANGTGGILIPGRVVLGADVGLRSYRRYSSNGQFVYTAGGPIRLGTVDSDSGSSPRALTLYTGIGNDVTLGAAGSQHALTSLALASMKPSPLSSLPNNLSDLSVSAVALNGSITTTGAGGIDLGSGAVTLGADVTLDTHGGNGAVTMGAAGSDGTATPRSLTIASGSGAVALNGAIGAGKALKALSLTGTGATSLGGAITTNGAGGIALGAGAVTLKSDVTLDTHAGNGGISVNTIDSDNTATVRALAMTAGSGTITLNGALGAGTALGAVSLTTTSPLSAGVGITAQNADITLFGGGLTLGAGARLTTTGSGNIILGAGSAGTFTNQAGNSLLSLGSGRWLVYSSDPRSNSGEMAGYGWRRYNATYANTAPASVGGSGFLYSTAPTVGIIVSGIGSKTYDGTTAVGDGSRSLSGSGSGINGDTVTATVSAGSGSYADRDVGTGKTVTFSGGPLALSATDANGKPVYGYTVSGITGQGDITRATLAVSANGITKTYGQTDPALGYMVSGLGAGDSAASVLSGSLQRTAGENVGRYAIGRGTLAANGNYTLSFTDGTLAITPATLRVLATDASKTYGQSDPALGYTVTGLAAWDSAASVLSGSLQRTAGENVGRYAIGRGTLAANGNYTLSFTDGTLAITPATLRVLAADASKTYGQSDPVLGYTVTGLVVGDSAASVLSGGLLRTAGENVGRYAIGRGTLAANGNYTLSFTDGTLAITPATLRVLAASTSKTYGQADPALGYTVAGLVAGDSAASVLSGSLQRTAGENAGRYAIGRGTLAANGNYTLSFTGGTLAITRAELFIQGNGTQRITGNANPPFTAIYSGLMRGDDASVVRGLTFSTVASASSPAGTYAIVPSGAFADNYAIRYGTGILTVIPAPTAYVPTPALGGMATGGTSSATGFQNPLGSSTTATASPGFVAPASAPVTAATANTGTGGPAVTATVLSGGGAGGPVSVVTAQAPVASGGRIEAAVDAGGFKVIYSQPANYQVATAPAQAGGGTATAIGSASGGALAASTSFTTFSSDDRPSVSVVNAGTSTSGGAGSDQKERD